MTPQGNNDSPEKCFKVMGSQYPSADKRSPETSIVKFEIAVQFKFK